jgi:hypothetical protein
MTSKNYLIEDERHVIVATCTRCMKRFPYSDRIDTEALQYQLDLHEARCQPFSERFFKFFCCLFVLLLVLIFVTGYLGWF